MVGLFLIVFVITGCTFKPTSINKDSTGDIQELTWIENTWTNMEMEEFTWEFDSWVVPTLSWSNTISIDTWVVGDVDTLIEERNTQPKDDTKLTEEDITLMEEIITKIQDIWK